MTITPTPLVPAPAGTASAGAGSGKGEQQAAAAGFGALLAQLAAASLATGKAAGGLPDADAQGTVGTEPALPGSGGEDGEKTVLTGASAQEVGVIAATMVAAQVAPPGSPSTRVTEGAPPLSEAAVRGVSTTAPPGSSTALPVSGTDAAADVAAAQPATTQPPATTVDAAAAPPSPVAGDNGTTATPGIAAGATTASNAAPAASATGTAAPSPSPLLDQVTPVVSRMVGAGEGSHRMVLRLHPADLGEVQLTVTVRAESVDVTVAAGTEARELLGRGSHELRALLESIGRTAGQITFKDLPGAQPQQSVPLPQSASGMATGGQGDAGQQGTSYGGLAGEASDRGGREGSRPANGDSSREHHHGTEDPGTSMTSTTPGNGAVDVRI